MIASLDETILALRGSGQSLRGRARRTAGRGMNPRAGNHVGAVEHFREAFGLVALADPPGDVADGSCSDYHLSGEKALMLAVLEDAIRCFQEHLRSPRDNPRRLSRQAEEWARADDWDWPFSFNNVCDTLGLNPHALRTALFRWKDRRLTSRGTDGTPSKVYRLHLRARPLKKLGSPSAGPRREARPGSG
jgi:hypothetical protein